LLLEGVAVADGGQERVNRVQVVGVDKDFSKVSDADLYAELSQNEIAISENLAQRLQVAENDNILVQPHSIECTFCLGGRNQCEHSGDHKKNSNERRTGAV